MIVLIAISERTVVSTFNTAPITGRQAIFARANLPTETEPTFEIVGVYTTLDIANAHREAHARDHPGCKYSQKVCTVISAPPGQPPPSVCIICGTETTGTSFCLKCATERHRQLRDGDPDLPAEPDPVRFAAEGVASLYASRPPVWSTR